MKVWNFQKILRSSYRDRKTARTFWWVENTYGELGRPWRPWPIGRHWYECATATTTQWREEVKLPENGNVMLMSMICIWVYCRHEGSSPCSVSWNTMNIKANQHSSPQVWLSVYIHIANHLGQQIATCESYLVVIPCYWSYSSTCGRFCTCLQSSCHLECICKSGKTWFQRKRSILLWSAYKSVKSNKKQSHMYLERWWLWHFHVLQAEHKNAYVCNISHKVAGYFTQSSCLANETFRISDLGHIENIHLLECASGRKRVAMEWLKLGLISQLICS